MLLSGFKIQTKTKTKKSYKNKTFYGTLNANEENVVRCCFHNTIRKIPLFSQSQNYNVSVFREHYCAGKCNSSSRTLIAVKCMFLVSKIYIKKKIRSNKTKARRKKALKDFISHYLPLIYTNKEWQQHVA